MDKKRKRFPWWGAPLIALGLFAVWFSELEATHPAKLTVERYTEEERVYSDCRLKGGWPAATSPELLDEAMALREAGNLTALRAMSADSYSADINNLQVLNFQGRLYAENLRFTPGKRAVQVFMFGDTWYWIRREGVRCPGGGPP